MTAAKRPPPCRCDVYLFPHRRGYECGDNADGDAPDEIAEQQQREWNADRAQDARAINGDK